MEKPCTVSCKVLGRGFFRRAGSSPYISRQWRTSRGGGPLVISHKCWLISWLISAPRPPMHFLHKTFPGTSDKISHCAKFHSSSWLISWLPKSDLCETTERSPPLDLCLQLILSGQGNQPRPRQPALAGLASPRHHRREAGGHWRYMALNGMFYILSHVNKGSYLVDQ